MLKFAIIISAYNEEDFIGRCLQSLLRQTILPSKIIVVDDGSTDKTVEIVEKISKTLDLVELISSKVKTSHQPGAKVIQAFKRGLETIHLQDYDVVCKFDADLEFPENYLEGLKNIFLKNPKVGLCGGVCTVYNKTAWQIENLTNFDHVRGALKAYRVEAFKSIGGLQSQMGWDTADEFKLRFRRWEIYVDKTLNVKHLKPTALNYQKNYFIKQGKVFYALRYGFILTLIAALKISLQKKQWSKFIVVLQSYRTSKTERLNYLLTQDEGSLLRQYRWKQIYRKFWA